jgi:hypothetical protein
MDSPSIPIALVIIVAAGAVALLAMGVLRRIGRGPLLVDPTRGTSMATVVGAAFAILLAFMIIVAFQTYNGAKSAADSEGTATLEMFRTEAYFPPKERDAARSNLVCYGRAVAYSEWPAMREDHTSPLVVPWINRWNDVFHQLDQRSYGEREAFSQLLQEDDARTDAGVARFREAAPSVPSPLWFALIIGACLAVALQLAMTDPRERFRVHGTMIAFLAAVLTAGLLVVNYLDHPYSGLPGSIKPTQMQFTLAAMKSIAPGLKPPCDAVGRPVGPLPAS